MRRVITFALVVALTYTGLGVFAPAQPMPGPRAAAVRLTAQASQARVQGGPVRRVHHQGPGELAGLPAGPRPQPVRPLRPARGLPGPPRANEQCPAHLVGRTATISIQAAAAPGQRPASTGASQHGRQARPGGQRRAGPHAGPPSGPSRRSAPPVTRDAQDQEMRTSLADPGVSVTGTYTGDDHGCCPSCAACGGAAAATAAPRRRRRAGRAGARAATAQVLTRTAAALCSGPAATASALRDAVTPPSTHAARTIRRASRHRGRRHRHARRHRAAGTGTRRRRHTAGRHQAGQRHRAERRHRDQQHRASGTRPRSTTGPTPAHRKHRAAKHRAR